MTCYTQQGEVREMNDTTETRLMRLLHGELPGDEARRLERRLEHDEALRASYRRLAAAWESLAPPVPGDLPDGFAAGVVAAARRIQEGELRWSLAPAWARAGAAAALAAGLLLGAVSGGGFAAPAADDAVLYAEADADAVPLSLAEVYWLALEESGGALTQDPAETVR